MIVDEYKRAIALFKKDRRFSPEEISYMGQFYFGILDESAKNLDGLYLVINSFSTQMTDAGRLGLIEVAGRNIEQNLKDLRQFTQQAIQLSLQRAKDHNEIDLVKALYGIR